MSDSPCGLAEKIYQLHTPEPNLLLDRSVRNDVYEHEAIVDGSLASDAALADAPPRRMHVDTTGATLFPDLPAFAASAQREMRIFHHAVIHKEGREP
jgi:hypothetical protein